MQIIYDRPIFLNAFKIQVELFFFAYKNAKLDECKYPYYLLQKYITKNENSLFIDKKRTNYCSIMDQHLVWHPLASMTAAILRGMDS